VPIDATINAGTAGVQQMFALLYERASWDLAVSAQGLYQTYTILFGYPFDYTVEPLVPVGLSQPEMQLPFEPGVTWAFTGGPHGGWADGSAWAALDFAPNVQGCEVRDEWVTAVADGLIIRVEFGAVVQDLDGDGREGTGWTVLYMHIAPDQRVTPGTYLQAGERIGHPSCEGGFSTGTHLHLARRYNGEWIAADGDIPFVLDGWVSSGTGIAYDGYLRRDGQEIEAWDGFFPENTFLRP
jgi:murein DD-endopeptidase MepM/ murein hydrolase activator NlpD